MYKNMRQIFLAPNSECSENTSSMFPLNRNLISSINIAEVLGGANGRFGVNGIERAAFGALSLQGFNSTLLRQH